MSSVSAVEEALARATTSSVRILGSTRLSGGDISEVSRLETSAGTFVLKSHPAPPDGFFHAESTCLSALRAHQTALVVPSVIAVGETFLVLEDLGSGRRGPAFEETFGRGLAGLHRATASEFGFERDTFCGTTRQPNGWSPTWVDFYGALRLGPQLELASRAGLMAREDRALMEQLISRLDRFVSEPADAPSLLHGDLWSGNVHTAASGAPAVIDPSTYFGHREAEWGMMTLFGSFSSRVHDAYQEAYPLEPDWRERNPIYQLYHLMNHLNLFGVGYHSQVMAIVRRYA